MFTGIIESLGRVRAVENRAADSRLWVDGDLPWSEVKLGDSIATNGVCLTVVAMDSRGFAADVSAESLRHSNLGRLKAGAAVNLERAMPASGRFDGHMVSGHVDAQARLLRIASEGRSRVLWFELPASLSPYMAVKGSVCLDGISLTVNQVEEAQFSVNIVPHSAEQTTVAQWQQGQWVNIEVDLVARYLERLLSSDSTGPDHDQTVQPAEGKMNKQWLLERGFGGHRGRGS